MGKANQQVTMLDLFLRVKQPVSPDTIVTQVGVDQMRQKMTDHIRDLASQMYVDSHW